MEDREIVALFWERAEEALSESRRKYGGLCFYAALGLLGSPEEALARNEYVRNRGPVEIPVYKEDGETIVDRFVIGG